MGTGYTTADVDTALMEIFHPLTPFNNRETLDS
jgi:hypothetical protein